jgi:hypothetical protein
MSNAMKKVTGSEVARAHTSEGRVREMAAKRRSKRYTLNVNALNDERSAECGAGDAWEGGEEYG